MGKDEIIIIDNHHKLDIYADQYITTGGHHSHEVSGKEEVEKNNTKAFDGFFGTIADGATPKEFS